MLIVAIIILLNIIALIFNRNAYNDLVYIAASILLPILLITPVIEYFLHLPMTIVYVGETDYTNEKILERKIFLSVFLLLSIWSIISMLYVFVFNDAN